MTKRRVGYLARSQRIWQLLSVAKGCAVQKEKKDNGVNFWIIEAYQLVTQV